MGIVIKLINSNKEIATYALEKGKSLKLKAIEKLNYQLVNEDTGGGVCTTRNFIEKRW
ncbi:hypothetical protein [Gallibacterium anatis]|uniref:hypothetical protein n=1 Tax=Gallibacterium anatis TaxID=750 RepID=UPI0012DB7AB4|nr:hypothetical protein [Gallibacterium anatis]